MEKPTMRRGGCGRHALGGVLGACLLVACLLGAALGAQRPVLPPVRRPPPPAVSGKDAAPPAARKLPEPVEGTRWQLVEPGDKREILFAGGGVVRDMRESGRGRGQWTLTDGVLEFGWGGEKPGYIGWLSRQGDVLGVAEKNGKSWVWRAKRGPDSGRPAGSSPPPVRVVRRRATPGVKRGGAKPRGSALAGSRWTLRAFSRSHEIELLPGGRMRNLNGHDKTPDNDTWESDGDVVRLLFNDKYATYRGCLRGATEVEGAAINVRGKRWPWSMTRIHGVESGDRETPAAARPAGAPAKAVPRSRPASKAGRKGASKRRAGGGGVKR